MNSQAATQAAALLQRDLQTAIDTAGRALSGAPAAARELQARSDALAGELARRASSGVAINGSLAAEQRRAQIATDTAVLQTKHAEASSAAMVALSGIAARALAALREAAAELADLEQRAERRGAAEAAQAAAAAEAARQQAERQRRGPSGAAGGR